MNDFNKNQLSARTRLVQFTQGIPQVHIIFMMLLGFVLSSCGGGQPQLTYRAGGTASEAIVTFIDGEGNSQEKTVNLPWETTIEISSDTFDFQLTIANTTSEGEVTCEVLLNEKSMMDAGHSNAYIDCNGDVTQKGNSTSYHISTHPIEAYLNNVQKMYDDGDYDAALAEIDKAIEIAPDFSGVYFMKGLILRVQEDYDQALNAYSQAIALDSGYIKAYNNRGLVYQELENLDSAIEDWTTALELDSNFVNGYFNRSKAYFTLGDYEAAEADVLKVQELSDDPEMLTWAEGALNQLANVKTQVEPTEQPQTTEAGAVMNELAQAGGLSAGQWVFFTSVTDSQRVIQALNLQNGSIQAISPETSYNWDASLSPDGRMIAFVSAQDGNPEIYVMNVDGSNLTRLTYGSGPNYSPVWSPDSNMIAFVTDRNGNADIYVISIDGTKIIQITNDPAHDWYPTWNEDGTEIAFVSERDGDAEIFIFNTDGTTRQLTNNTYYDADPAWSPNGRFIAFSSAPDGAQADIYIIRPDGSDLQQITDDPAEDIQPGWSFDSNNLIFASDRDSGTMDIYAITEAGDTIRFTKDDVDDRFPAWGLVTAP
jgi:Tol biopolymer transport system component